MLLGCDAFVIAMNIMSMYYVNWTGLVRWEVTNSAERSLKCLVTE